MVKATVKSFFEGFYSIPIILEVNGKSLSHDYVVIRGSEEGIINIIDHDLWEKAKLNQMVKKHLSLGNFVEIKDEKEKDDHSKKPKKDAKKEPKVEDEIKFEVE